MTERQLILVVDDTPDNIRILGNILRPQYEVKAAHSGEKALQVANVDPKPDMIWLDIMMPDMDDYEVCRQLKTNPKTADIPVIFITAKGQVADERLGFELGAVDYITKPISPPLVLARVATHLELAEKRHKLEELLKKTLIGIISVLTDLLAISNPTAFARASRLRRFMREITEYLNVANAWQYDAAAMLSQIGCISMSPETLLRLFAGAEVSSDDRRQYREQFVRSAKIVNEIPHLHNVAQMLERLAQEYGAPVSIPSIEGLDVVTLGVNLLNTALYFDDHMQKGRVVHEADQIPIDIGALTDKTLEALTPQAIGQQKESRSIAFRELQLGMIVAADIYARNGLLVLPEGLEVTEIVLEHLQNFHARVGLVEPLMVA